MPTGSLSIERSLMLKPHDDNIITLYFVACSALFLHIVAAVFSHCDRGTFMHFTRLSSCHYLIFVLGSFGSCVSRRVSYTFCAHSCTLIPSTLLNLAVLSLSLLLFSPCGAARKPGILIELSRCIASPLPASCPQALEYSF